MSHPEQLAFFECVARENADLIQGGAVLEIGSYDVNGTVRSLFRSARRYTGVDLTAGPGVDVVGFGHEFDAPEGSFDLVISGECFEHDPHWRATLANMVRLTRPGGLVAVTCASRGRPEHGTSRTDALESPGTQELGFDHYRNLALTDLESLPLDEWFDEHRSWYVASHFDLLLAGVRRGGGAPTARLPQQDQVDEIRRMMPIAQRAVRAPLRLASRMIADEDRFQEFAVPYWATARRLFGERSALGRAMARRH